MRLLILLALLAPAAAVAQTGGPRHIVRLEETIRAGIDRDAIDSIYADGSTLFGSEKKVAYDDAWNGFLGQLLSAMLENDVTFSELVLRAYFSADGRLEYLLFHVGGDEKNNRGFVKAVEKVQSTFRFSLPATAPFRQSATIALGSPEMAE
jgi:hypothetical protein